MKKHLLTLISISTAVFVSCNNTPPQDTAVRADSVKNNSVKEEIAEKDQNKVIGNIEFGISKSAFDKKTDKFLKSSEKVEPNGVGYNWIGDYQFAAINGYFHDKKLYYVIVHGWVIDHEDYDTETARTIGILKTMLVKKYGEPTKAEPIPPMYAINEQYRSTVYSWKIGKKNMDIDIKNNGTFYSCDLNIYQPEIQKTVNDAEKIKADKVAEEAKDIL